MSSGVYRQEYTITIQCVSEHSSELAAELHLSDVIDDLKACHDCTDEAIGEFLRALGLTKTNLYRIGIARQ